MNCRAYTHQNRTQAFRHRGASRLEALMGELKSGFLIEGFTKVMAERP